MPALCSGHCSALSAYPVPTRSITGKPCSNLLIQVVVIQDFATSHHSRAVFRGLHVDPVPSTTTAIYQHLAATSVTLRTGRTRSRSVTDPSPEVECDSVVPVFASTDATAVVLVVREKEKDMEDGNHSDDHREDHDR